jgi:hypothetical protein
MATGDIKIGIDIVSNTKEETKDALKLKQAYEGAANAASKMGGTAGSRSVAAKAAPAGSGLSGKDYGTAQGTSGMGSSARDFAKEAQGLGGLVRVYATFAANLFAVSAAFTALRDAASTENIIKGLDQLGAVSGRSLGNLSKQLVAASDGAISLRDSMTAVAQASSGGLSNKQILQLGEVAKKTSEALGLSMPDAISRLSRGITKIEPELLDELGIFVKVNEASSTYALSIGKSAASLSDFEKRQAFANAVLDQGIKKFADIKIDANPYDKLLASMSNVATTGLQLVNKVLGPIASILAESPGALAGVFALIGATLLRQAIPALSQWRNELTKSAEASAASAKRSYESFRDYSISKALEREAKAVGPINQEINAKIADAQTALAKTLSSKSKILAQAMSGTADPEALKKSIETEQKRRETALSNLMAQKQADITAGTATADRIAAYDKLAQKQHEEIINLKTAASAVGDIAKKTNEIVDIQTKSENQKGGLEERIRGILAARAQAISSSKSILARVGEDTEAKGMGKAFTYLFDNIKNGIPVLDDFGKVIRDQDGKIERTKTSLTGLRAATTALSGSFLIVGDAIGKGLSAIAPYLQLLTLAITAYQLFSSWASLAGKQQEEFNTKISEGEATIKTVSTTFDTYVNKTKDAFTTQGISAFTTALAGVSDSLDSQLLAYSKYKEVAGVFDKLKDSMAGAFFFSQSNLEKLQQSTVESVQAVVKSLELSGKANSAKGTLAEALFGKGASIDKLYGSTKELNKAFDGLTGPEREEKIKQIAAAVDLVTKSEQYSTNAALAFQESLNSIDKIVDQIIQANAFSDLQGKLGVDLVLASERFGQALADPLKALSSIVNLAKDPKALAALGNVDIEQLSKAVNLQKQLNDAEKQKLNAIEEQKKAKEGSGPLAMAVIKQRTNLYGENAPIPDISAAIGIDIAGADRRLKETSDKLDDLKKKAAEFSLSQISLVTKIADAGFEKIEIGLKKAKEQAQLSIARTQIGISASGGADTADRAYKVRLDELKIQQTLIEANYKVQIASIENSQKLDELNTTMQLATAAQMKTSNEPDVKRAGEVLYNAASQRNQIIGLANAMKTGGEVYSLAMRTASPEMIGAARARNNETLIARSQADAQIAGVRGQRTEAGLTHEAQLREEALRREKERLDLDNKRLNTQTEYLNLASQIAGYESEAVIQAKLAVQNKLRANDVAAQLADIEKNRKDSLVGADLTEQEVINKRAKNRSDSVIANAADKSAMEAILAIQKSSVAVQTEMSKQSALDLEKLKLKNSVEDAKLNNLQAELGFKLQLGLIDERSANAQKAAYDLQALKQKSAEEEKKLKDDVAQKQKAVDDAKPLTALAANLDPATRGAVASSQKDLQNALDLAKAQLAAFDKRNKAQEDGIEQAKTYNDLLIEQKQNQDNLNATTKALATILGDVGQNLGDTVSGFSNLLLNNKKRAIQEKEAAGNAKNLAKLRDQNAKDELSDISSVAGATKKLFDDKSNAYRVLGAVEKVAAAQRLALEASTALQSIGINIPAIYASFMAALGPFGPPAAAVAIAAFLGSAAGGGGGDAATFDYGTYKKDQGNYIDSSTPTNTGIKDSLDTLVGISKPELPLTSKMARHLENIDGKIQTFVNYQLNNIGNANAGITPSSSTSGANPLVSMGVGSALGAVAGTAVTLGMNAIVSGLASMAGEGIIGATFTQLALGASAASEALAYLGDLFLPGAGTIVGAIIGMSPAVQHLTEVLFTGSDSITTGLQGMGYEISKQTIAMASSNLAIQDYADILTTRSHSAGAVEKFGSMLGFGGGDSTSTSVENRKGATNPQVKAAFEDMFSTITDNLKLGAKSLGVSVGELTVPYKKIEIVANDAKGNLEKVNTYFAEVSDDFVTQIIPDIQKYTAGTENATQTYYRLSASQEEAGYYAEKLGIKTANYTQMINKHGDASAEILKKSILDSSQTTQGIKDIIETYSGKAGDVAAVYTSLMDVQLGLIAIGGSSKLVNADLVRGAGGVDALNSSWGSFQSTYLTTGEQKLQQQVKMDQEFKKLGLITPKTAQGFRDLVLSLIQGGEANSETLGSVLTLTDGMSKLVGGIDDANTSLKTTISNFTSFGENVKKYRESLILSASSVATTGEKLAIAKTDFDTTLTKAIAGDTKAQGNLASLASTVLDLGRSIYASSPDYVKLYNEISSKLQEAESSATQSVDVATLQLDQATSQTGLLTSINQNITDFLAGKAVDTAKPHAAGGLAYGMSLVGEHGPELVDFTMPGQVYTANQTRGMFAGNNSMSTSINSMVVELQQLREEVCQLRKDQQKQTGDIIISNYDANEKASTQVADAVAQTSNDAQWATRNIPVIK